MPYELRVDGRHVELPDDGATLLEVLRDRLGCHTVKDGCSPQGQCGCCTVLIDGTPRVACVTPARRVAGRTITTLAGLPEALRRRWAEAFCQAGASQCGFCTPGIIVRLAALSGGGPAPDRAPLGDAGLTVAHAALGSAGPIPDQAALGGAAPTPDRAARHDAGPAAAAVDRALLAHLCRCTGWRTITAAATGLPDADPSRDLVAATRRAGLEGGTPQRVGPEVALGEGGFADDSAPPDALVAVPDGTGGWAVGESVAAARAAAGQVQGRRSGAALHHPLEVPPGDWAVTLRTTWVEPGYLEPDSSWCQPGGEPVTPLANGGAFGGKLSSPVAAVARQLADRYDRPVRVLLSRQDVVRLGPKRPPVAAGVRADGTGVLRIARTAGIAAAVALVAPGLVVEELDVTGPPTSAAIRAAGWAEALVLAAAAAFIGDASRHQHGPVSVRSPAGADAAALVDVNEEGLPVAVQVSVGCGDPLDEVVLRSYAIGAAHMALGWVCSEGIALDRDGRPEDVTIRSFGILRATDTPAIDVRIEPGEGPAVPGSDAVFAAVAAATWIAQGLPRDWPTRRGRFR